MPTTDRTEDRTADPIAGHSAGTARRAPPAQGCGPAADRRDHGGADPRAAAAGGDLPVGRGPQARPDGVSPCRPGPPGPIPRKRRCLHHPPDLGCADLHAVAARRRCVDGRAAARRPRGHGDQQAGTGRAVRPRGRRDGRRPVEAGQDQVRQPRAGAGRELSQDAAGDGARRARHPGQARRPAAQHAHARCGGSRTSSVGSPSRRWRSTHRSPTGSG